MAIEIRAAEPGDYEGVRQVLSGPNAVWGTRQLPFPSSETWRKRLAETTHGDYRLVACIEGTFVRNTFRAGRYVDAHAMARFRKEERQS
jgi:L-phenylalanine/L-methionine N-acetyltransferase